MQPDKKNEISLEEDKEEDKDDDMNKDDDEDAVTADGLEEVSDGVQEIEESTQMHHELDIMPDLPRESFSTRRARENRDGSDDPLDVSF